MDIREARKEMLANFGYKSLIDVYERIQQLDKPRPLPINEDGTVTLSLRPKQ